VFGSWARGEQQPGSDLDLLVDMEPGRSLLDFVAIKQDLEDLLGCRVDVVTERSLSPYLRERAYDIVSTVPYIRKDDAGLSFCGSKEFGSINVGCFRRLERKLQSQASLDDVAEQVTKRTVAHVEVVAAILDPVAPEIAAHIVQRIKSESARFLARSHASVDG
jgi:predicted nucleotidyltransferase